MTSNVSRPGWLSVAACSSLAATYTGASDYSLFLPAWMESGNTAGTNVKWIDFRIPNVETIIYRVRFRAAVMAVNHHLHSVCCGLWPAAPPSIL